MPKGPNGQKRPADVIGAAVLVGRIATGELEDVSPIPKKTVRAAAGHKGGTVRAKKLSDVRRVEIAKKAAKVRWTK